jgi:Xaa-Pro aminopeptidase
MNSAMYRANRARALAQLRERRAAAVIPTARAKVKNHDTEFRFRPDSDFWWLTGFDEPDSVLVLLPALDAQTKDRSVLFLRDKKRDEEVWSGIRLGVAAAPFELGIDAAHPVQELWTKLAELLRGYERVVYRTGLDETRDREMLATIARMRAQVRATWIAPQEIVDTAPVLHELRLFKSEDELAVMRRAAEVTARAHIAAMRETAPGVRENEIEALIEYTFRRAGANGPAYGTIVAGGANACTLHYVRNDRVLADGDLLLIDAGAEFDYYACDVTRTFPVNGRFSAEQRALYEVVLGAQLAAIERCRPNEPFQAVHDTALRVLVEGLIEHGLLAGPLDQALAKETYKRFYMHRTSHWLGLDVHDCGAYVVAGETRALAPGMVLTVEPGLYVAEDDTTVEERWRGIGIRIEDDVLVTVDGNEVLTRAIPKTIDELESLGQSQEKAAPATARS